jgi:hypothetical protein
MFKRSHVANTLSCVSISIRYYVDVRWGFTVQFRNFCIHAPVRLPKCRTPHLMRVGTSLDYNYALTSPTE